MSLHTKIKTDWIAALKEGNQELKKVLSFIKANLNDKAKAQQVEELDDAEALVVLRKMAKEQRDFVDNYGSPEDKFELEVIEGYLPQQMGETQIEERLMQIVEAQGLELTKSNMGKIMGALMKNLKGQADGALVRKVVSNKLE